MFINNQFGGQNLAFPDVCKTIVGPALVPLPYPNISLPETAVPAAYNILIDGGPAHNLESQAPFSQGDDAGLAGGLVSQLVMGPTKHLTGAFTCLLDGMPATRLGDLTGQNGELPNCLGATVVPAQVKVLCLAG